MKRFNVLNESTGLDNRIGFNIRVVVACLTGQAPGIPLSEFVSIWKQILPESGVCLPVTGGQSGTTASPIPARFPNAEGNIREGPD